MMASCYDRIGGGGTLYCVAKRRGGKVACVRLKEFACLTTRCFLVSLSTQRLAHFSAFIVHTRALFSIGFLKDDSSLVSSRRNKVRWTLKVIIIFL